MQYIKDTVNMAYGNKDLFVLQIGDEITTGYSYSKFYMDSLLSTQEGARKFKDIFTKSYSSAMSLYGTNLMYAKIYKDYKRKTTIVSDHISTYHFVYEEELRSQNWKILNDTTNILGYRCQKAICNFRGRSYEAWFTPDIPLKEGPWKFGGLPGLIIKLQDIQNHYCFELKSFKKVNEVMQIDPYKAATVIERRQFLSDLMGEKGKELTNSDLAGARLGSAKKKEYDYIERDYK
jgi:GLPGLI family protein